MPTNHDAERNSDGAMMLCGLASKLVPATQGVSGVSSTDIDASGAGGFHTSSQNDFLTEEEQLVFDLVSKSRATTLEDLLEQSELRFKAKMLRQGWCPHLIIHLLETFGGKTLDQLSNLQVSPSRKKSHGLCLTEKQCVAFNVDEKTYETAHSGDCLGCTFLEVPYRELVEIIAHGGVPLISIEGNSNSDGSLTLRLHRRHIFTRYTAFSHVWADGLGNPASNSLPICQLQALRSRLTRITGKSNSLFWLDTLCIPVKTEDCILRIESIDLMGSIYARAQLVLVLDSELTKLKLEDKDECLGRIACSLWMSRCWTLQEAALAKYCAIEFEDGSWKAPTDRFYHASIFGGMFSRKQDKEPLYAKAMLGYLRRSLPSRRSRSKYDSFVNVWNELTGRSTTKAQDFYLIFANLIGLSSSRLMDLPEEDRFPAIVLSMERIPFSLLLMSAPKYDLSLNRWLPLTMSTEKIRTTFPCLRFWGDSLVLDSRSKHSQSLLVYTMDTLLLPPPGSFIYLKDGTNYIKCWSEHGNELEIDVSSMSYICIVVDAQVQNRERARRVQGAIFLGTQRNREWMTTKLNLTYLFPIHMQLVQGPEVSAVEMRRVRPSYRIHIAYNCPTHIRKFRRKASGKVYDRWTIFWLLILGFVAPVTTLIAQAGSTADGSLVEFLIAYSCIAIFVPVLWLTAYKLYRKYMRLRRLKLRRNAASVP